MKTAILMFILSFSTLAQASDCLTWYGGSIPKEQRTQQNCPTGTSHWERQEQMANLAKKQTELYAEAKTLGIQDRVNYPGVSAYSPNYLPQVIVTNGGNYVITRSSGTGQINAIIGPPIR